MRAYERLIKYASFPTASNEENECCPSTPEQLILAEYLKNELIALGLTDADIDENGYLYATIPANTDKENVPAIGFIAHMDVVSEVPYENIKARLIKNYDGGDIVLNEEKNIVMSPLDFDTLPRYKGKTLVVTDGTTLLGADDKAGVAEIVTAAEKLISDRSIPHGTVKIGFTPDEEIGRGADLFDVKRFGAEFAYTVDGAAWGEVEYENFNAAALSVSVKGKSIHPGSAKNKMINAITVAREFDSLLPALARPEHTEGYEGFFHAVAIEGSVENTVVKYILRDHDKALLEEKKEYARRAAAEINLRYGDGTVTIEIKDSYANMREVIEENMHIIDIAYEATRLSGREPESMPVRGGTDGARLSFMGLPCPNLGTGSHNHHGRFEYAIAEEMDGVVETIINIAKTVEKRA